MNKVTETKGIRLAGLVALLALCLGLLGSQPAAAQGGTCVDDVTGRTNVCTANDVEISEMLNEVDISCTVGSLVDLALSARLVGQASERYDIGIFVALDGGDARTGTCSHDYLPPPLSAGGTCSTSGTECKKTADCPAGESCVGGYDPLSGSGPFYNAELAEDPLDACGDVEKDVETYHGLTALTVPCQDSDGDGYLDIGTCLSWDNQKTSTCLDADGAVPGTKSKCRCERIRVGNVIVIPGEIRVTKVALPEEVEEPGGDVAFTFAVQNTSQVVVTIETLEDSVYGNLVEYPGSTCTVPQTLEAGATYSCSITAPVIGVPGVQTDTVTASGTDENGNPVSSSAAAEVLITDVLPAIEVLKTADPTSLVEPGGAVEYSVRVTNNSSASDPVTLTSLLDSLYGDLTDPGNTAISDSTCELTTIQPNGTYECTFTAQVSGIGGGSVTDTVTAEGADDEGNPVQASADATVTITVLPPETGEGVPAPVVAAAVAALGIALLSAGMVLRRRTQ
jgi:hypothetical protein